MSWAPDYDKSRKVDLNTLTREQVASWKPGDTLLLSGRMLTGRCLLYTSDAADERSSVDLGGRRIIKKKKSIHASAAS